MKKRQKGMIQKNRFASFPWLTYSIFLLNTIAFGVETILALSQQLYPNIWGWLWMMSDTYQPLLKMMGALVSGNVVWEQPWRLLSFLCLHAGFLHYASNMYGLLSLRQMERRYGRVAFLTIYLLGGLASGLGAMITFVIFPETPYVIGASGAIYALYTALFVQNAHKKYVSYRTWPLLLLFWMASLFLGNPFAHISGALVGGLLGWFLLKSERSRENQQETR